ncbi:MAG: hypothetical protein AMXMBFR58_17060 [Phycisphaerae bacterium]|nr:hypothetical protein [Phycisphaerales bacterium]
MKFFSSLVLASVAASPAAAGLSISWFSIDAGGSAAVSAGAITIGSTIGQHDAGTLVSGGAAVVGGFWAVDVTLPCPADYDGTGFVDTDDFTAFVIDFEAGVDQADFDGTGFVDTDDFTAFVLAFEAGC